MSRNITVTVPDELSEKMNTMTDVNWSGVTRDCIERYISARTNPSLGDAVSKIRTKKEADYQDGFNFVVNNIDKLTVNALEEIACNSKYKHEEKLFDILYEIDKSLIEGMLDTKPIDEEKDEYEVFYTKSLNFVIGMKVAASNILDQSEIYKHSNEETKEEASV